MQNPFKTSIWFYRLTEYLRLVQTSIKNTKGVLRQLEKELRALCREFKVECSFYANSVINSAIEKVHFLREEYQSTKAQYTQLLEEYLEFTGKQTPHEARLADKHIILHLEHQYSQELVEVATEIQLGYEKQRQMLEAKTNLIEAEKRHHKTQIEFKTEKTKGFKISAVHEYKEDAIEDIQRKESIAKVNKNLSKLTESLVYTNGFFPDDETATNMVPQGNEYQSDEDKQQPSSLNIGGEEPLPMQSEPGSENKLGKGLPKPSEGDTSDPPLEEHTYEVNIFESEETANVPDELTQSFSENQEVLLPRVWDLDNFIAKQGKIFAKQIHQNKTYQIPNKIKHTLKKSFR